MVMPNELQANSYLFSPTGLVVFMPRTAETNQASQTDSQQGTEIINRAGGGVPALNRANTTLSRWYPVLKWGKGFLIPPFRKSGEQGMWLLTETRRLHKMNSNVSAWGRVAQRGPSRPLRGRPGLPPTALHCTNIALVSWPLAINPGKTWVNIFWHTALQTSKSEQICKVINLLTNCLDLLL